MDGRAVVPFIDPRRETKRLTAAARQFVFSVMHERFIADPDLDGVRPCIVQFGSGNDDARIPSLHFPEGIELLDFDTLDAMIQETYAIWGEVLDERDAATRRAHPGRCCNAPNPPDIFSPGDAAARPLVGSV